MQQFAGQPFTYVGVNSDKDRHKAATMAREQQLDWINVWCGPEGTAGSLPESWGVTGWPSTFLLDRAGRIRFRGLRGQELQTRIAELLAEGEGR
ncbi:MAG: hypothetical protein KDC98_01745 [Planctomycetes bacterium]|nr:hypothetical protein [Planctomycetota bacterium]